MCMYLLDTSICVYVINKRSKKAVGVFSSKPPFSIALSSVTLAELEYGVSRSQSRELNRLALVNFAAPFQVLTFDDRDAEVFGVVRAALERRGQTIDPYDLQIAAQALSRDLTLVTKNMEAFEGIAGLRLEDWDV